MAGHSTRSAERRGRREAHAVAALGDRPEAVAVVGRRCGGCRAGPRAGQAGVELGAREPRRRAGRAPSRRSRRRAEAWATPRNTAASRVPASDRARGGERSGVVDRDGAAPVDDAGAEADGRPVALADLRTLITKRSAPAEHADLVGVGDDARVAQRGGLDGVLVGEGRAEQQPALGGELGAGIDAVGDALGVVAERAGEVAVPAAEARRRSSSDRCHLVVVEGEDAVDHAGWPRDSCPPRPSWPGTNSCVTTRDVSARSRSGSRRDEPVASVTTAAGEPARVLQRGDQGERRLGALVEVGPGGAGGRRSRRRSRDPTSRPAPSLAPRNHAAAARSAPTPTAVAGDGGGAGAGVGDRGDLDRLLVEARARGRPVPRRRRGSTDRWPSTVSRSSSQGSSASPSLEDVGSGERRAGGDQRLGQHGVGVGQAGLGPRPRRVGRRPGRALRRRRSRSASAAAVTRVRRRSTSAAPSAANAIARGHGDRCSAPRSKARERLAHAASGVAVGRGRAEAPELRPQQSSTPRRSCHRPARSMPVAAPARHALGVGDEPQSASDRGRGRRRPGRGSRRDHEQRAMSSVQ